MASSFRDLLSHAGVRYDKAPIDQMLEAADIVLKDVSREFASRNFATEVDTAGQLQDLPHLAYTLGPLVISLSPV